MTNVYLSTVFDEVQGTLRVGRRTPYGDQGIYQSTPIFSISSSLSPSNLRDETTVVGSGAVSAELGKIKLSTGATPNSSARLETHAVGYTISGTASEAQINVQLGDIITDSTVIRFGIGDSVDGAFYEIDSTGIKTVLLVNSVRVSETYKEDWIQDTLDGSGASGHTLSLDNSFLGWGFRFTDIGKMVYTLVFSGDDLEELGESIMHLDKLSMFGGFTNSHFHMFAEVLNGTDGNDYSISIGHRRFDITGKNIQDIRETGELRLAASVPASANLFPLISMRQKALFPGSVVNHIPSALFGYNIISDQNLAVYVTRNGTINGTFATLSAYDATETSIESNITCTTQSGYQVVGGPRLHNADSTVGNITILSTLEGLNFNVHDEAITLAVRNLGASAATIQVSVVMTEHW